MKRRISCISNTRGPERPALHLPARYIVGGPFRPPYGNENTCSESVATIATHRFPFFPVRDRSALPCPGNGALQSSLPVFEVERANASIVRRADDDDATGGGDGTRTAVPRVAPALWQRSVVPSGTCQCDVAGVRVHGDQTPPGRTLARQVGDHATSVVAHRRAERSYGPAPFTLPRS
jgi:hypothetical protein